MTNTIFFGSFQHYSTKVLKALHQDKNIRVLALITTPSRKSRIRGKTALLKTHTHLWAEKHNLPVFTPEKLDQTSLRSTIYDLNPDFFVVAGYGNKLSSSWLKFPKIAPLNLHFSLLPKYRGANPAEWAILMGEKETGVSLIKMAEQFDTGPILSQEKLKIADNDTRETLYEKLYDLAAQIVVNFFSLKIDKLKIENLAKVQPSRSPTPYARKLGRPDGFIPWAFLQKAMKGEKISTLKLNPLFKQVYEHLKKGSTIYDPRSTIHIIERAIRALAGFPGVWTKVATPKKGRKRLKILSAHLEKSTINHPQSIKLVLDQAQLEGLKASTFNQIKNQLTITKNL